MVTSARVSSVPRARLVINRSERFFRRREFRASWISGTTVSLLFFFLLFFSSPSSTLRNEFLVRRARRATCSSLSFDFSTISGIVRALFLFILSFLFFFLFHCFIDSFETANTWMPTADADRMDERKGKSMLYDDDVYWPRNLQVLSLSRATRKRR